MAKSKTKAELQKENLELKKKLDDLTKTLNLQMEQLVQENKELKEKLSASSEREKFVGIRSTIDGAIWLPAPESKSGDAKDRNKGKYLEGKKATIVPAYWVADWITSGLLPLRTRSIVVDNEAGKKISPGVNFTDVVFPDDFFLFEFTNEEFEQLVKDNDVTKINYYINKYKNDKQALAQMFMVVENIYEKAEDESELKINAEALMNRIDTYLHG